MQEQSATNWTGNMQTGLTAQTDQEADAEADRLFGATLREMASREHGEAAGRKLRTLIIRPTRPGTTARAQQDKAWSLRTARLGKLLGDAS